MNGHWQYQLRVYLNEAQAEMARHDRGNPALKSLTDILAKHQATLFSQYDAFAAYLAEAEKNGPENYPLYKWTKATLEDPEKRAKHSTTFALRIANAELYSQAEAEALEADLQPLIGAGLVERMSKHDSNPANNLPIPAEYKS